MGSEHKNITRRTSVVVALFLVAAAAVVYFAYFYPSASQEDSAGTIGAVRKYRVQQISENDIILAGQEIQQGIPRPEEFLDDAAKLQSISLGMKEIAARLQSREEELGKKARSFTLELGRMSELVESQSSVLEKKVRSMSAVAESVNRELESRASDAELAGMRSELAELSSRLASSARLDAKAIGELAARLDSKIADFESRKLRMATLESMGAELGSFQQELESKAQLDSRRLEQMGAALESYAATLESRSGLAARSFAEQRSQLQAIALEGRALANAEAELGSLNRLASAAAVESRTFDTLGARLASASEALANDTLQLEQKAVLSMKEQLASFSLEQRSFGNLDLAARTMSRNLESRSASSVEAKSLESKLGSFIDTLGKATLQYGARSAATLNNQLAACSGYMESRRQLGSQVLDNMRGYMAEARSMAGSFTLEQQARQNLESRLGGLNSRLENATTSGLENRSNR